MWVKFEWKSDGIVNRLDNLGCGENEDSNPECIANQSRRILW